MNESLEAMNVLRMSSLDEVFGADLNSDTQNPRHPLSRLLCIGPSRCLHAPHTVNKSYVLQYQDKHGALQNAERQVQHHLQCKCQET